MKILFFHRWVGVRKGGAETHIKELATRLAQMGHTVDFLTLKGEELKEIKGINMVYTVSKSAGESLFSYIDIRVFWYTLLFMFKSSIIILWLKLKGINYDAVSVHFATEAIIMHWLRPFLKWPFVYVCEGYSDLEARVAKKADIQIAISKHIIDNYYENFGYKPNFIRVGVDTARFSCNGDKYKIREEMLSRDFKDKFIVLTVCRLFPDKDLTTLVRAAKKVTLSNQNIVFLIVGDGGERPKIEKMIAEFNLNSRVILAGSVNNDLLPKYYCLSDMFVLTEVRSGFSGGIVFLEAMSAGLPIIASDAGGTAETLEDFGILFPPGDAQKLAENIIKVSSDRELYQRMRTKGLVKVKNYDWNTLIREYEKAYTSVIHRKDKRSPIFQG